MVAADAEEGLQRIHDIHTRINETAKTDDKPCEIKISNDYAALPEDERFLAQIRRKTEKTSYKVSFENREELVRYACNEGRANERAVIILPRNMLSEHQQAALEGARNIIYINFKKPKASQNPFYTVPLEGLIAAGKAYLNGDEESFYELYELLTLNRNYERLTLETLRGNPELFITALNFILQPITAENPDHLDQINDRMELLFMAV